jgi:BirA family transcriptional regulator, biotin operon repressor / biotin---[acetyl-CoA-carboxylase] ligase
MLKNSNLLPQTPLNTALGRPFIILSSVESTNNYAMAKLHAGMVGAGTCFQAIEQTAGKGQRGKSWSAAPGENITMSVIANPGSAAQRPFLFSAAVALACHAFVSEYANNNLKIKWPNDIYLNDRKAGGILIENVYQGHSWAWAIAGIGLNINQTAFPDHLPNAISLKLVTGKDYPVIKLGKELASSLEKHIRWMNNSTAEDIMQAYNERLFKKDREVKLKKDNMVFSRTIQGVSPSGELIVRGAMEERYQFGEVEWMGE